MAYLNFDATQVEPNKPYEPLPDGKYAMVFVESEMKPTKTNTGSYLQLTAEVIEGEYKGKKVWERLNLDNPNAQAVEIAQRTLSSICHAIGVMTPQESEELHDRPFIAKVSYVPPHDQYKASNDIDGYEPYNSTSNQQPTPTQQAAAAAQAQAPQRAVVANQQNQANTQQPQEFWKR